MRGARDPGLLEFCKAFCYIASPDWVPESFAPDPKKIVDDPQRLLAKEASGTNTNTFVCLKQACKVK